MGREEIAQSDTHEVQPGVVSPIKGLIVQALNALDTHGESGLERFLQQHADSADEVRRRVHELQSLGLLSGRPDAERLGRYTLLGRLGSGGMGVVRLARDERLQRTIALKTLPAEAGLSGRARERFQREARAVAKLQHPNIVQVYEVDEADGLPFFTMQYVDGITLSEMIDGLRNLDTPVEDLGSADLSRIASQQAGLSEATNDRCDDLLLRDAAPTHQTSDLAIRWGRTYVETICRFVMDIATALAHVHRFGIIHRDVKPSNIIITAEGKAMLFDFGLARLESEPTLTRSGDLIGTVHYVSPEQVEGSRGGIDQRTDVYSLGVTLYELLTLTVPFSGETTNQILRQIGGRDPTPPRRLNAMVPRDLETICLKAMDRVRERRYQSAADMAADIDCFLGFRPISARPAGTVTRALRLFRRNRAKAVAAALALLIIIGTPTMVVFSNLRAERRSRQAAEEVSRLLMNLIFEADVEESGPDTPVGMLLERAEEQIVQELSDQPLVQGQLLTRLGAFFLTGGQLERSARILRQALEIRVTELGESHIDTSETQNHLANACRSLSLYREAEDLHRRSLATRLAVLGAEDEAVLQSQANLAGLLQCTGEIEQATALLEGIHAVLVRTGRERSEAAVINLGNRADILFGQARLNEAEVLLREALALCDSMENDVDLLKGNLLGGLGRCLLQQGRARAAIEAYRAQVDTYRQLFHNDSWYVGAAMTYLAVAHWHEGDLTAAQESCAAGLAALRASVGENHLEVGRAESILGEILHQQRDLANARSHLAEAERIFRALGDAGSWELPATLFELAQIDLHQQDEDSASAILAEATALHTTLFAEQPEALVAGLRRFARSMVGAGFVEHGVATHERAADLAREMLPDSTEIIDATLRELERARGLPQGDTK